MSSITRSSLSLAAALSLSTSASAGIVATLDFENIAVYPSNAVAILEYYNGGAAGNGTIGPDYGVSFTGAGSILCMNIPGTSGCNASRGDYGPSQWFGFYWETGTPIMNVADGFDRSLSFDYSNAWGYAASVAIFSGLDGSGDLLASLNLSQTTAQGCEYSFASGAYYCPLVETSIPFTGTARSVKFISDTNNVVVFDDIQIPEPATWTLLIAGAGLAGTAAARRRRSVPAPRS